MSGDLDVRSRIRAHAKVNLSLEIGARRPDGFHAYESWATSIGLADTLDFEIREGVGARRVSVSTGLADTLVGRTLELVGTTVGRDLRWDVNIEKVIPAGAGLGGGSADAAAALAAVAVPLDLGPTRDEIARALGTDIPFCLSGGCARLHGRGELVDTTEPLPPIGILVAVPPVELSTREVFRAFDTLGGTGRRDRRGVEPPALLARVLPACSFRNDLEPAALAVEPGLARWKARIEDAAARPALMTGSGSGFVCLADRPAVFDESVLAALHAAGVLAWVTTPVATGLVFEPFV
ncbi:MAG: 4-(cytidine 5'-diphospho)-2-C-methyl-D-erythritol kinase [Acidimicrobiia bacterium]|nr:4-(cytidine 5'-diphospho)-2-C-methyl-D-erythritol kinase [Acidimicrobiia bacterium]